MKQKALDEALKYYENYSQLYLLLQIEVLNEKNFINNCLLLTTLLNAEVIDAKQV